MSLSYNGYLLDLFCDPQIFVHHTVKTGVPMAHDYSKLLLRTVALFVTEHLPLSTDSEMDVTEVET